MSQRKLIYLKTKARPSNSLIPARIVEMNAGYLSDSDASTISADESEDLKNDSIEPASDDIQVKIKKEVLSSEEKNIAVASHDCPSKSALNISSKFINEACMTYSRIGIKDEVKSSNESNCQTNVKNQNLLFEVVTNNECLPTTSLNLDDPETKDQTQTSMTFKQDTQRKIQEVDVPRVLSDESSCQIILDNKETRYGIINQEEHSKTDLNLDLHETKAQIQTSMTDGQSNPPIRIKDEVFSDDSNGQISVHNKEGNNHEECSSTTDLNSDLLEKIAQIQANMIEMQRNQAKIKKEVYSDESACQISVRNEENNHEECSSTTGFNFDLREAIAQIESALTDIQRNKVEIKKETFSKGSGCQVNVHNKEDNNHNECSQTGLNLDLLETRAQNEKCTSTPYGQLKIKEAVIVESSFQINVNVKETNASEFPSDKTTPGEKFPFAEPPISYELLEYTHLSIQFTNDDILECLKDLNDKFPSIKPTVLQADLSKIKVNTSNSQVTSRIKNLGNTVDKTTAFETRETKDDTFNLQVTREIKNAFCTADETEIFENKERNVNSPNLQATRETKNVIFKEVEMKASENEETTVKASNLNVTNEINYFCTIPLESRNVIDICSKNINCLESSAERKEISRRTGSSGAVSNNHAVTVVSEKVNIESKSATKLMPQNQTSGSISEECTSTVPSESKRVERVPSAEDLKEILQYVSLLKSSSNFGSKTNSLSIGRNIKNSNEESKVLVTDDTVIVENPTGSKKSVGKSTDGHESVSIFDDSRMLPKKFIKKTALEKSSEGTSLEKLEMGRLAPKRKATDNLAPKRRAADNTVLKLEEINNSTSKQKTGGNIALEMKVTENPVSEMKATCKTAPERKIENEAPEKKAKRSELPGNNSSDSTILEKMTIYNEWSGKKIIENKHSRTNVILETSKHLTENSIQIEPKIKSDAKADMQILDELPMREAKNGSFVKRKHKILFETENPEKKVKLEDGQIVKCTPGKSDCVQSCRNIQIFEKNNFKRIHSDTYKQADCSHKNYIENMSEVDFDERKGNRAHLSKCLYKSVGKYFINLNDLSALILEWNPTWLSIQKDYPKLLPPICQSYKKIKVDYTDESDYYNTYFPLHLLSIWLRISEVWENKPSSFDSVVENQIEKPNFVKVTCSTVLSIKNFSEWPKREDMLLCRIVKENGCIESFFGRVCNVMAKDYDPPPQSSLLNIADLLRKVKFEFLCAEALDVGFNMKIKVQILCNIRIALMQNDALQRLNSTVKAIIIEPSKNLSQMSFTFLQSDLHPTFNRNLQNIVNSVMSPDILITLVDTSSPCDVILAISRLVMSFKKKNIPVLVGLRSKDSFLRLAYLLKEYNLILAIRKKEFKIPDELEKFSLEEHISVVLNSREVFRNWYVSLTLMSCINFPDFVSFAGQKLACIVHDAHLCTETETALLVSYDIENLILMGNSEKGSMHPLLEQYSYNMSLYHRLWEVK